MAFLSGNNNSYRDQDVRRPGAACGTGRGTGAGVLVMRHLNKAAANNPLYRGGGSIGIIGAARMAFSSPRTRRTKIDESWPPRRIISPRPL